MLNHDIYNISATKKIKYYNKVRSKNMSKFIRETISVSKEGKTTVIQMDNRLCGQIWHLVKDWPDIISNDENLKTIADLNFAKTEQIKEITEAFYQMFNAISEASTEVIVRIIEDESF